MGKEQVAWRESRDQFRTGSWREFRVCVCVTLPPSRLHSTATCEILGLRQHLILLPSLLSLAHVCQPAGSTAQRRSRWHNTLGSPYHRDGPGHRTRYTIQVATCNKVGIWASSSYGNSNVRDLLSSLLQNCNGSLTLKSNCDYLKSHCKIVFPKIWVNPPTTAYLLLKI